MDHGSLDVGYGGFKDALVVLGEALTAAEPTECPYSCRRPSETFAISKVTLRVIFVLVSSKVSIAHHWHRSARFRDEFPSTVGNLFAYTTGSPAGCRWRCGLRRSPAAPPRRAGGKVEVAPAADDAPQEPHSESLVRVGASRACDITPTPHWRCVSPVGGTSGIPRSAWSNQGV